MNDNDRSILAFTSVTHALVHTYELSIPVLMLVWLSEFHVTTATLGTVVAVGYALFGLGALPAGVLADRVGSHRLVVACLVGMGGSFLLLSLARGVLTIAAALAVWGVAASVYHPAGLSLISTGVDERGTGFAYHGMAGNVGIAFGPLVTAVLLLRFPWPVVTGGLALLAIAAAVASVGVEFDETAAVEADGGRAGGVENFGDFVTDSRRLFTVGFALAVVVACCSGLYYRGTLTFLPDVLGNYLPDLTAYVRLFEPGSVAAERFDLAAYVYVGLLTVGIGGQYLGGLLTDRVAPPTGVAVGFAVLAGISTAFVSLAESGLVWLLAVSAALGFVLFALQPLYQATIAEYSPAGERGLSYGYTYTATFGVGAAGAAIAGFLLSVTTVQGTFLALAAIPAVGAVVAFLLSRRPTR